MIIRLIAMRRATIFALAIVLAGVFILPALADTSNVTVKWTIPQDVSFSVAYPTGLTAIEFEPTGASFTNQPAKSQGASTPAINFTNTGNVNIDLSAAFTADFPTNVTEFRINTTNDYNGGWYWTDANETTSQTIKTGLAPGSTVEYWAWTSSTGKVPYSATPYERTWQITSSAS